MKVYQCDRCKKIFEPCVLPNGCKYITRKGGRDVDLCDDCMKAFDKWFGIHHSEGSEDDC